MARDKKLHLRNAIDSLEQALKILKNDDIVDDGEIQRIDSAARISSEATKSLYKLSGMMDSESDLPKRAPTPSQNS